MLSALQFQYQQWENALYRTGCIFLIVISDGEIRQEQITLEQVSLRNMDSLLLVGQLFVTFLWIWQIVSEIGGEGYGEENFGTWTYKTP